MLYLGIRYSLFAPALPPLPLVIPHLMRNLPGHGPRSPTLCPPGHPERGPKAKSKGAPLNAVLSVLVWYDPAGHPKLDTESTPYSIYFQSLGSHSTPSTSPRGRKCFLLVLWTATTSGQCVLSIHIIASLRCTVHLRP